MKKLTLNNCDKNKEYEVLNIDCQQIAIARRLTELGFVENAKVRIIQFSALKKTLLIEIEGYVISLRASVAQYIRVDEV